MENGLNPRNCLAYFGHQSMSLSLRQDLTPLENLTFCKEDVSPEEGQGPAVPFPRVHPHSHVSSSACNYSVEENDAKRSPGALGEQSQ